MIQRTYDEFFTYFTLYANDGDFVASIKVDSHLADKPEVHDWIEDHLHSLGEKLLSR